MTTTIAEWSKLRCECGNETFVPVVRLKYKDGGGTAAEPAGHQCTACQALVDNAYMIRLVEMNAKRRQLRQLQEELGEEAPAPVAVGGDAKK